MQQLEQGREARQELVEKCLPKLRKIREAREERIVNAIEAKMDW